MEIFHTLNLSEKVISLQCLGNDSVAISDKKGIVRVFEQEGEGDTLSFKTSVSIKIPAIKEDTESSMVCVSYNKILFAAYDKNAKNVKVFDIKKKKLSFQVEWHQGVVDIVKFDMQNKYLVTGGQDGKVCVWSCSTGRLVYSLPPHLDYVSALEFHENNRRFASAGYDCMINVIDLRNMELICQLKDKHKKAIRKIKFFSINNLISVDRLGNICVWNYKTAMFLYSLPKIKSDPVFLTVLENEYVIIAGKDSYVSLFSLSRKKILNMRYIYSSDGIQAIDFDSKSFTLFISTLKNTINCYDFREGKDDLQECVVSQNYSEAYLLLTKNPLLEHLEPYVQVLFEIWDDTIKEAVEYLEDENLDEVKRIFEPFMAIASKAKFINSLILDYKDFKQFRISIEDKKFNLSSTLLMKHPSYKESSIYERMQEEWDLCVKNAESALSDNSEDVDAQLYEIFKNFRGISDKLPIIREIGSKRIVLSLFNKSYEKENFTECYNLIEEHPFLSEVENYRNLVFKEQILYDSMKKKLEQGEYNLVKNYAKELIQFPTHKNEIHSILININKVDTFKEYYLTKNYRSMMSMASKYTFLEELIEMKAFNDLFEKTMELAETYSAKGNIAQIMKIFEPYILIKELQERMGKIISSAYVAQLKFLANKYPNKAKEILEGINNYIFIFGEDDSILSFVGFLKNNLGLAIKEDGLDTSTYTANYTKWVKTNLPARIF